MKTTLVWHRVHYAWVVLAVGTMVVFGALGLARFGYSLLLPAMQVGLNLDNTAAGGLATANLIGYLALSLIGGALAARYGPRLVTSVGMTFAGIGMLATGTSGSLWSAMVWRTVTGLGSGASNVPTMALMTAWFGPRWRGLAAGVAVAGSSLALIVTGPLVPRILTAVPEDGWRVTWYLFGASVLLLALLSAALLRDDPGRIGLRPLGEAQGSQPPPRAADPGGLEWGRVYRSPAVWHLGVVYAAFGFAYIIYVTFFIRYLTGEILYTRQAAGNLFMIMGWFSLGCGLLWGGLSDRIGRRPALVLVYLIQALAFSLFALWPAPTGLALSAVLFGLTAWSIPAIMAAICGDVLGHRLAPAALGFITLFFGIGQALGPSVAGAMADASGSFTGAFLLAAGVAILGAVSAWLLRPVRAGVDRALVEASPGGVE
jgi:MFS family permease